MCLSLNDKRDDTVRLTHANKGFHLLVDPFGLGRSWGTDDDEISGVEGMWDSTPRYP